MISLYIWLAVGGAAGTLIRFGSSLLISHHLGTSFPWGTLIVNTAGSFAIGFFAVISEGGSGVLSSHTVRQFVMTGLLGGFTTFSTFSLQTMELARQGEWLRAGANAGSSLALCLVAVWLGHIIATTLVLNRA